MRVCDVTSLFFCIPFVGSLRCALVLMLCVDGGERRRFVVLMPDWRDFAARTDHADVLDVVPYSTPWRVAAIPLATPHHA